MKRTNLNATLATYYKERLNNIIRLNNIKFSNKYRIPIVTKYFGEEGLGGTAQLSLMSYINSVKCLPSFYNLEKLIDVVIKEENNPYELDEYVEHKLIYLDVICYDPVFSLEDGEVVITDVALKDLFGSVTEGIYIPEFLMTCDYNDLPKYMAKCYSASFNKFLEENSIGGEIYMYKAMHKDWIDALPDNLLKFYANIIEQNPKLFIQEKTTKVGHYMSKKKEEAEKTIEENKGL